MALYAFDGTSNKDKANAGGTELDNTNVLRFFQIYDRNSSGAPAVGTNVYKEGVGTRHNVVGAVLGGLFGLGELARIDEAYDQLCKNWVAGDTVIDIVGFSRGAATTLDFCQHLFERGIRKPGTKDVVEPNPTIRFLGLWDTVAAFGLANLGNEILNFGHHLKLPKQNLEFCFHAMALDERRLSFLPTRLPGACEVWFRGVHSDVGGGNGRPRGLSDLSLRWMLKKAQSVGLPVQDHDVAGLNPNPAQLPHPAKGGDLPINVRVVSSVDRRHYSVGPVPKFTNPPATCPVETEDDEREAAALGNDGIELLPADQHRRLAALFEAGINQATAEGTALQDDGRIWLLNLLATRVILVGDDRLTEGRSNVAGFIKAAAHEARLKTFTNVLPSFFLEQALFNRPHLFPLTD